MKENEFRRIVEEEWRNVPRPYKKHVKNVALLIEDEPSETVRKEEGLEGEDTLLGLYQGVPNTARGEGYGIGETLPDTVTVYRLPTLTEAEALTAEFRKSDFEEQVRMVVRDTLWHELGHYFGYDDDRLHEREDEGTNTYPKEKNEEAD